MSGLLLAWFARDAGSQTGEHDPHARDTVTFPVSCAPAAQAEFSRAVILLHHMTYPQAREAFRTVAATDPRCAMAHWGIAMTLFQPLWPTRPGPDALSRGWAEVQKAKAHPAPSAREQLFIAATEAFFLDPASTDYWLRIRRWAEAMARLRATLPQDNEVAVFHALAILASAPADTLSRVSADRAATILVNVLARQPGHPGAMHYLIHANDVPGREREELEVTRTYESAAPSNPHALHMPTHIYTRLGDWDGVARGNLLASEAALHSPAGPNGDLVWDEFPHAIEYLVYAYLQQGADHAALGQLQRLRATPRLEPTFKTAFHLASTEVRYALERHAWTEAAQVSVREPSTLPWDRFPWPEAITWFGRGLGAARLGDLRAAEASSERLAELEVTAQDSGEVLFTRNIRILRLELNGWISHLHGRSDESLSLLREAIALEVATPKHAVTPGPTVPASELLGDLLMEQGRAVDALAAYQFALSLQPRRYNSLLGAARAARASGQAEAARAAYQELLKVASVGSNRESLREARAIAVP